MADNPPGFVIQREANGRWLKGQSGNPHGEGLVNHRLAAQVSALARQHAPEAIEGLLAIARDNENTPPAVRVAAWNSLLDRGVGKPPQAVAAVIEHRPFAFQLPMVELSEDEWVEAHALATAEQ
jgi:hypothetical protein